jgi:coenzyme F420-reducing hydrogenase delta subunit
MKVVGMSPDRLKIIYCTAAEGQKFQNEAIEIDKTIRKLGPSSLRTKPTPKKGKAKAKAKA